MRTSLVLVIALFGCSSSQNESPPQPTPDAATDTVVEAGEKPFTTLTWTEGPTLMARRDHHTTALIGDEIWVFGGIQDASTLLSSTERASLVDGTLGAWSSGGDLLQATAGHGIAVVGNTVILSGGRRGPAKSISSSIEVGRGAAWTKPGPMSVGRFHHSSIAVNDDVFFVGGLTGDGKDSTPSVEVARVTDGALGALRQTTPLPEQRSHHSLARVGSTIYASGGLRGDPAGTPTTYDDVLMATVGSSGELSAWTVAGKLAVTVGTHASFAHAGFLYVVGGVERNAVESAAVRRTPIREDGTLGEWESLAPLPRALAHCHQVVLSGNKLFVVGGARKHISSPLVFVGTFSEE